MKYMEGHIEMKYMNQRCAIVLRGSTDTVTYDFFLTYQH